jgi:hypothetical protein
MQLVDVSHWQCEASSMAIILDLKSNTIPNSFMVFETKNEVILLLTALIMLSNIGF